MADIIESFRKVFFSRRHYESREEHKTTAQLWTYRLENRIEGVLLMQRSNTLETSDKSDIGLYSSYRKDFSLELD